MRTQMCLGGGKCGLYWFQAGFKTILTSGTSGCSSCSSSSTFSGLLCQGSWKPSEARCGPILYVSRGVHTEQELATSPETQSRPAALPPLHQCCWWDLRFPKNKSLCNILTQFTALWTKTAYCNPQDTALTVLRCFGGDWCKGRN